MMWEKIVGQSQAIELLRRGAAAGRLPHALLFAGPAGVGKKLVARTLATALLCERFAENELEACGECRSCRMMPAGTHPDFLSVACPEGKSELPIELIVGSRENRGNEGLCHDLSLRPMTARRRVAVIADADRMNVESANALLKTLEEPPSYAVIILIAADSSMVLPTIRSRCQTVRFRLLPAQEIARLTLELGWTHNPDEAREAAELAGGSLAVARQLLSPALGALQKTLFRALGQPAVQSFTLAQSVLAALEEIGGDTQAQRTHAQWVVRFLIDYLREALRIWCKGSDTTGDPTELPRVAEVCPFLSQFPADDPESAETIGKAIERCVEAGEQLAGNVSIPLCLEALFSDLATILNSARPAQRAG